MSFRAVALDLFDTLVRWSPDRLPRFRFREHEFPSTMPHLIELLGPRLGTAWDQEKWCEGYFTVLHEISAEREKRGIEVTCETRFDRALARFGMEAVTERGALASILAREHMKHVRAVTSAPPENVAIVRRIAERYRLALVSNFDDGETGRAIVEDTGLASHFETILISADLEIRKPNPKIFHRLLADLGLEASEVLFVGDTPREDVAGAQGVGMPIAWLDDGRKALPEGMRRPDYVLPNLVGLSTVLSLDG
ncbi:MAG: HAD family hydrolase [Candidatus Binatia bacterium]